MRRESVEFKTACGARRTTGPIDSISLDNPNLVEVLLDDGLLARGQALMDDTTAHRRLRRLAAILPPATQVYRDSRLPAAPGTSASGSP
jgi:hypothetical protein